MKKAFLGASMASMAILAACGDSDSGTSTAASEPLPEGIVKTVSELGVCNKAGETQQVLATGSYYRCENGEWVEIGWEKDKQVSSSSVRRDETASSSSKAVFNEDDAIVTPKSSSSIDEESSSSEFGEDSSSSEDSADSSTDSSSSEADEESSSSTAESSSSEENDEL